MLLRHVPYTLELRHPFGIASHTRTSTPATLIELAHDGVTGYGEAAMPPHLGESQASVAAFLTRATPLLTALRDPFQLEEILPALDALAPGNTAAKAAVDLALHDWIGKKLGAPWHRIWGLDAAQAPVTSFTIDLNALEALKIKPPDKLHIQ
jgi:L-alanine-DL-glutamate epimerase-like enolase superfamily enzyme